MTLVHHDKLVRDNIPHVLASQGIAYTTREASDAELPDLLIAKLEEEVAEFRVARNVAELADILEVVHAIAASMQVRMSDVEKARLAKFAERGGFTRRIVLLTTEE